MQNHFKYKMSHRIQTAIQALKTRRITVKELEEFFLTDKNTNINACNLAVEARRSFLTDQYNLDLSKIPYSNYDYKSVYKKNCENVIGFTQVPLGIVGPLKFFKPKASVFAPLATTEGALIASINRGCKWINENSEKFDSHVTDKGMTRSPILKCSTLQEAENIKTYIRNNIENLKQSFAETTNYGNLTNISFTQSGRYLHVRFEATTGYAMGMNMISKGVEKVLEKLLQSFPQANYLTISGNTCTDKKASAINLVRGRGKSVITQVVLNKLKFEKMTGVLSSTLVNLNKQKNFVGSALAGTIGGNNANVSNIIAAFFLATGQDLGQIGTSSFALLDMEIISDNELEISLSMPCIEIGTIGGGTSLENQNACIQNIVGTQDPTILVKILSSVVLAGELSLMVSLCKKDLTKAHMKLNRKTI